MSEKKTFSNAFYGSQALKQKNYRNSFALGYAVSLVKLNNVMSGHGNSFRPHSF